MRERALYEGVCKGKRDKSACEEQRTKRDQREEGKGEERAQESDREDVRRVGGSESEMEDIRKGSLMGIGAKRRLVVRL